MWVFALHVAAAQSCDIEVRSRVTPVFPPHTHAEERVCRAQVQIDGQGQSVAIEPTDCAPGLVPAVAASLRRWDIRMSDACTGTSSGRIDVWFEVDPNTASDAPFTESSILDVASWEAVSRPETGCALEATYSRESRRWSAFGASAQDCLARPVFDAAIPPATGTCTVRFQVKAHRSRRVAAGCDGALAHAATQVVEGWTFYNPHKDWLDYAVTLTFR